MGALAARGGGDGAGPVQKAATRRVQEMNPLELLLIAAIAAIGSFFGSYLKRKGENLATREGFDAIKTQTAQLTETTEAIKGEIAKINWVEQKKWGFKQEIYTGLIGALQAYRVASLHVADWYELDDDKKQKDKGFYDRHKQTQIENAECLGDLTAKAHLFLDDPALDALEELKKRFVEAADIDDMIEYMRASANIAEAVYVKVVNSGKADLFAM